MNNKYICRLQCPCGGKDIIDKMHMSFWTLNLLVWILNLIASNQQGPVILAMLTAPTSGGLDKCYNIEVKSLVEWTSLERYIGLRNLGVNNFLFLSKLIGICFGWCI